MFETLLQTATGSKMLTEARGTRLQQRGHHVKALADLDARDATQRAPLVRRRAAAELAVKAAQQKLVDAKAELAGASRDLSAHDHQINVSRSRHELGMRDTAGDDLENFRLRCGRDFERLTDHRRSVEESRLVKTVGYDIATGPITKLVIKDNMPQIAARLERLAEIGREAEQLALTKLDFAADLESMWDSLPDAHLPQE